MTVLRGSTRAWAIDLAIALVAFAATLGLFFGGGVSSDHEAARGVDALGVTLAALSTLPLVARRWSPFWVYVAVVLANAAMNAFDYPDGPPFGAAIALYFLASANPSDRPPMRVTATTIVGLFVFHFVVFGLANDRLPGVELLLGSSLWAAVWFAGERVRIRRERMAELEERAYRMEREAERERRLAVAEERTRIARDLHDSAGHAINVILVQAGAARLLSEKDPKRSHEALATIETVARETLTEIDRLVRVLRDDTGAEGTDGYVEPPTGLAALDSLVERSRRAGLDVSVVQDGVDATRALPHAVDQAAYRIVQESLTNALRHGRGATDVALRYERDALEITVTNAVAPGAATNGEGHGIVGMRERVSLVGGSLDTGSENGVFRVRARLPYARKT